MKTMPTPKLRLPILGGALALMTMTSVASAEAESRRWEPPIPFSAAKILIELNATAQDAGIQMLIDGEGWRQVQVYSPAGEKLLDVRPRGSVGVIGITELFFESAEPSLQDLPLEELLEMFPEGEYWVFGRTAEGQRMWGTAVMSHDIPGGPNVVTPVEGGVTDRNNTVIDWDRVPDPEGGHIRGYQVIVELPEPLRIFSVDLPANVTGVRVPVAFLQRGTEYKFEVLAITESGNQTITESTFSTAP